VLLFIVADTQATLQEGRMHRTLRAIWDYARLAGVIARTTGWALGVLGRNALRGIGHGMRNALAGRKDGQAAETSKKNWVFAYEPSPSGCVTIGFIATRWDEAPKVGIATTTFSMKASQIQARGQVKLDGELPREGMLASVLEQALRANLQVDDLGQFAAPLTAFLGRSELFSEGLAKGQSGFVVTFKMKGTEYRLRVSHRGPEDAVLRLMNEIDNIGPDYGHDYIPEELMYAFDFRPEDELITGRLEVQDGVATLEKRPVTLAKDGWLGPSTMAPHPEMFSPPPKRRTVRRLPASVLD
jgi:hypothetical protein